MARGKVTHGDEEQMRGAYDWAGEAGRVHGCAIRLVLLPTSRPGVWLVRAQAVDAVDGRAVRVRVQVALEWPRSEQQTLSGAIMNALMQLDHELGYDMVKQAAAV